MKKITLSKTMAVFALAALVSSVLAVPVSAGVSAGQTAGDEGSQAVILSATAAKTVSHQIVIRKGYDYLIQPLEAEGSVEWSSSNENVIKFLSKHKKKCKIKALKDGRAELTAKADNITIRYKMVVKSGKEFFNAWCKQWVKDCIAEDMDFKEKLILASAYVVSNNNSYGNTSEPEDVITSGVGNCVSGGRLVAGLCEAMGYDAKVRFAAGDDMSRYPAGVIFMEQHYNVEVTVDGRKYYIDGTPGSMMVYLSTKKKNLYYGYSVRNKIYPPDEFMDIPIEELLG